MRSKSGDYHPNLESAIDHLLSSGGKRIRPTVVLLACAMLGAELDASISLAAAIEMLHTATLVHDDLIDEAVVRRGIPTLNAQWSQGATVLTGDYIFARAAALAAETGSMAIVKAFARTLMTIVNGEVNQIFRTHNEDSRSDYLDRIYAKTASLFELASEGAAILSGCDDQARRQMKSFGYHLGMAFQIVDDVLDFVGEGDRMGKPVASDLRQGLITLPTLNYLEEHPGDPNLLNLMENVAVDEEDLERLIESIRSSNATRNALEEADRMVAYGIEILKSFPPTPEREALNDLAHYVVRRTV